MLEIFATHHASVRRRYPSLEKRRLVAEIIRSMINTLVLDLTETTLANIRTHKPDSVDAVRAAPPLAAFSISMRRQADALKSLLLENRSEEHTSELQSLLRKSYAVFCLKNNTKKITHINNNTH